ncbi:HEPN domain-containing protein [Candidatus Parcubacteria bacterium]|nr:HEPN domain-containing protein [Candidatus Parcubacteria bacterium]
MSKNNINLTKKWIIKSQNDLESAKILYRENGPTDSLCFHCHQAVEKILKGFLVFHKKEFPKIHDLILLLKLCEKIDKNFKTLEKEASFLNRYYIEARYPPEITTYPKKECQKAIGFVEKITQFTINKIYI